MSLVSEKVVTATVSNVDGCNVAVKSTSEVAFEGSSEETASPMPSFPKSDDSAGPGHPASESQINDSVAASSLFSTSHGRKRRRERAIGKVDLKEARRYGMREPARFGRHMYTYKGYTVIYDPIKNCEVTCYPSSDAIRLANKKRMRLEQDNDDKKTKDDQASMPPPLPAIQKKNIPVMLSKNYAFCQPQKVSEHRALHQYLLNHPESWTSHSVLVIDMSGSMRQDDVDGARCRSDGVWLALARDFVKSQLEQKNRNQQTRQRRSHASRHALSQPQRASFSFDASIISDVVSVIVMRKESHVIFKAEPLDWVLFNMFLDHREWMTIKPFGPGFYMPALERAEQLLNWNAHLAAGCALSLLFFSDGRPSDQGDFSGRLGRIASKFGRRLTISCIGMAEPTEDFTALQNMVKEADAYGADAIFHRARLDDQHSLQSSISSLVTSLTQSKTALTDIGTGCLRRVRTDVLREKKHAPDDHHLTKEWQPFHNQSRSHYLLRVWTWDRRRDDFVYIMDNRCIFCCMPVHSADGKGRKSLRSKPGFQCPDCKACFICYCCDRESLHRHQGSQDCQYYLEDRRRKEMVKKTVPSFSVAMKNFVFGEGVERIVRKFRFLDDHNNFIGPRYVAKESRFVEESERSRYDIRMDYHREFMRTQVLASKFASDFNEALDSVESKVEQQQRQLLKALPRFRFLEPLVVELIEAGERRTFLVEEMLDGKYQKFNNNMGFVAKSAKKHAKILTMEKSMNDHSLGNKNVGLSTIEESSTDGALLQNASGGENDFQDDNEVSELLLRCRAEDLPEAFSHFTYERSKRNLIVVDLQGVLCENMTSGKCEYVLTDPAIHKRNRKVGVGRPYHGDFGRTNRGEKGMKAFWSSHICTDACALLGLSIRSHNSK